MCKAPVKSSPQTNQHPAFYRPDALPVTHPTVSEHWREIVTAVIGNIQLCTSSQNANVNYQLWLTAEICIWHTGCVQQDIFTHLKSPSFEVTVVRICLNCQIDKITIFSLITTVYVCLPLDQTQSKCVWRVYLRKNCDCTSSINFCIISIWQCLRTAVCIINTIFNLTLNRQSNTALHIIILCTLDFSLQIPITVHYNIYLL